ncbi:PREDICTED: lysosomal alpha-mannosidase isoform X1 [Rhagoletis zephyria]|uniref:lysosomal alpha-mannosidase isoform X1 n=1 Tax=Rhagoletis zephyria TaxID=28612 RepID=UPI00081146F3|nr:PREDICTED: lysosomal alpha-mannosidase isoform X1 [Rhagoletis zephyria]
MQLLCGLATIFVLLAVLREQQVQAACGYANCPAGKANMINVHLVPHSHDDVGWLKTVDQYYYGARNDIQHAGVQYILDNVIRELLRDAKRRFIFVESAFFFKWYNEQTAEVKSQVKTLVKGGRLEFAGGAWSMNDEAAVHYQSVIDQFTIGLKALQQTFGACGRPHVGWQIDPFGHSREMASLFAQMGFDGQFFARMDWIEKTERLKNLTAEVIWKASEVLGQSAELFTGLLYRHYSAPPGFCFDALCSDAPIIDGVSYDNNVKERVDTFIKYIQEVTTHYRSTHVLIPMGDDFNYQIAAMNFKNMDKLIKYVNERQSLGSKVNLFYSTPACYLKAIHQAPLTWPSKAQDFFPYSTDWHTYWTGYYSSRPTQKRFERDGNHFLQVTKQLTTFANLTGNDVNSNLDALRHAMGVMQHHDAITGTEKQHVAADYDRLLAAAIESAQANARAALQKLTNLTNGEFVSCLQLNISVCEFTKNGADQLVVTLFNPLGRPSYEYVRVPVNNEAYIVTDETGRLLPSDLLPVPAEVQRLSFRPKIASHELVFLAYVEKLRSYYIKKSANPRSVEELKVETQMRSMNSIPKRFSEMHKKSAEENELKSIAIDSESRGEIIVKNSHVKLTLDSSGHLTKVEMNGVSENIRQEFYYYNAAAGNNAEFKNRSSGAYIFRPNGTELLIGRQVTFSIYEGTQVKEVHQRFSDWVSQVIRIYEGVNRVEFEWLVGPIPINDNIGKEVITRFTSNIKSAGVFYTDSNGREMLKRKRNQREYFKPNMTEAVSGNYYPITARIAIEGESNRIALLNDRAQGGSSLKDGALELMLHRRLLRDDAFGVGEALNETAYGEGVVARGKVYLILSNAEGTPSRYERLEQLQIHLPFWKFFSNATKATNKKVRQISSFNLPQTVHLLTLEPFNANERLVRLENFMDKYDANPVTFNLRPLFDQLSGEEIRETTLDGNLNLSEMIRFKFQPESSNVTKPEYYKTLHSPLLAKKKDSVSKFSIVLHQMQIRTFVIKWR